MALVTQSWLSRDRLRSTPAILRAWSVLIVILLALVALLSLLAARQFVAGADEVTENTGPVLITTQGLVASVAEADAAQTAVFLSGANEDRQQRSLYVGAIRRAPEQIEDISSRIGDDEAAHDELKTIAGQLTEYVGLVERARLGNVTGSSTATSDLQASLELAGGSNGMLNGVRQITERTQRRYDTDVSSGIEAWVGALALLVIAIGTLVFAQRNLTKRTQRRINAPLLLATFCTVGLLVWLVLAQFGRSSDFDAAQTNGYESIRTTAELQAAAFEFKTQETQAIIAGDAGQLPSNTQFEDIDRLLATLNTQADSDRERAAITILQGRWNRYVITSESIAIALENGDSERARAIAIGDGNRDFNGFNTTVENVLLTNRDQFNGSVDSAANRLDWLELGAVLLPLLAALLTLAGYQSRINEYW